MEAGSRGMWSESKVSLQLYLPTKSIIIDAQRELGPTRPQWPVNVSFLGAGGGGRDEGNMDNTFLKYENF